MAQSDVLILGAGAAGLLCAIEAGRRGRQVVLLEKAPRPGAKIRISGGGRCNFTNINCRPEDFLSENPHFSRSALARFTPQDFLDLVEQAGIAWHEKTLGQLFCSAPGGAAHIVDLLVEQCQATGNVEIHCQTEVEAVKKESDGFCVHTKGRTFTAKSLVIATGGPSIPAMGSTGFGYELARQFGLEIVTPEPALVPLTLTGAMLKDAANLAGVSLPVRAESGLGSFHEGMLFTHRGLSGPAILQISSYWSPGEDVVINLLPEQNLAEIIQEAREQTPRKEILSLLGGQLPGRLATLIAAEIGATGTVANLTARTIQSLQERVHQWTLRPAGTEGFRTAEVTRGGVSTAALSSKTMECHEIPDLYFIGEVVDVTGHLGGFNFQWAWASGYAAGQYA